MARPPPACAPGPGNPGQPDILKKFYPFFEISLDSSLFVHYMEPVNARSARGAPRGRPFRPLPTPYPRAAPGRQAQLCLGPCRGDRRPSRTVCRPPRPAVLLLRNSNGAARTGVRGNRNSASLHPGRHGKTGRCVGHRDSRTNRKDFFLSETLLCKIRNKSRIAIVSESVAVQGFERSTAAPRPDFRNFFFEKQTGLSSSGENGPSFCFSYPFYRNPILNDRSKSRDGFPAFAAQPA